MEQPESYQKIVMGEVRSYRPDKVEIEDFSHIKIEPKVNVREVVEGTVGIFIILLIIALILSFA